MSDTDTTTRPMTPAEFKAAMNEIASLPMDSDTEINHSRADDLLCKVLASLGYGEGVELFRQMHKWYA